MKLCEVCQHEAEDHEPTCPKCGEASWLSIHTAWAVGITADEQASLDAIIAAAPSAPKRRRR